MPNDDAERGVVSQSSKLLRHVYFSTSAVPRFLSPAAVTVVSPEVPQKESALHWVSLLQVQITHLLLDFSANADYVLTLGRAAVPTFGTGCHQN